LKKKGIHIVVLLIVFIIENTSAQDIHFSQIEASPLNLNPALAGMFDGSYRFVLNHKRQWNGFTNGYKTFSGSADRLFQLKNSPLNLGTGILLNSDIAGDGNFGIVSIQVPLSAMIFFESVETTVSFGVQAGITQHKVDIAELTFGSDYNGQSYDPSMSSGESFAGSDVTYADIGSGINIRYGDFRSPTFEMGISYFHLNQPDVSFSGERIAKLNSRMVMHAGFNWPLGQNYYLMPQVNYFKQGVYNEILMGTFIRIHPDNIQFHTMRVGFFYRGNDAVILKVGLDYLDYQIGISYDINVSGLNEASNGQGGLEFSLIYILRTLYPHSSKPKKYCPDYI